MSKSFVLSRRTLRPSISLLTVACMAALCASLHAQTAPQLLPYTVKVIAGGGTATIASGGTCPVSGFTATDSYGDGCLATEIELGNTAAGGTTPGARSAVADVNGNVFFTDYAAGLVRRVDAITGIVTAVAGGATSSPAAGTTCGTLTSTDSRGDGCLGTAVKLSHPAGIVFSPAGDLYFSDIGYVNVRKIAANPAGVILNTTNGVTTTTGVISLVDGNVSGTFGYASGVVAATGSYLQDPFGLAFDQSGNLYIADEYSKAEAILVVNTNTTGSNTVTGVTIPAGQVDKIVGSPTGGGSVCPNSPASPNGCNFGSWTDGSVANSSQVDGPYAVTVDPTGNVYFSNEFNDNVGRVTPAGIIANYAGIQGSVAKVLMRGPAGSFAVGSSFGITSDALSNIYFTDASNGVVWRVDGSGKSMYVVAGGASTFCANSTDAYGDGCPATQAKFGTSGTTFASATLPGPGIFGVSVDAHSDLFIGDTETNLVREVASGTQFGVIGANQPTNTVDIHFAVGDGPAGTAPYAITAGSSNFSVGTATCTLNSDSTRDCLLPLTATPSVLGLFTGTLTVTSQLGATASFALSGTYAQSPLTRTVLGYSASSVNCTGTSIYSSTTPITLTATLVANGPSAPTGTITFFANGTQLSTPQNVVNLGTTSNPLYGATLSNTFTTPNTYVLTATYSGNSAYFKGSTSGSVQIGSSSPTFTASSISYQQNTVTAGQTGLYSFNLAQNVYTGTITLACSGLPANSSCSFSPATITSIGCSTTSTVAMSILTQNGAIPSSGSGLGIGGRGWWSVLSMVSGFGLALLIGLRRRNSSLRFARLGMVLALLVGTSGMIACSGAVEGGPATPAGNYTVTVTATGSTGTTSSFTVPLTVK